MAHVTALTALAALGLSVLPFHGPFHAQDLYITGIRSGSAGRVPVRSAGRAAVGGLGGMRRRRQSPVVAGKTLARSGEEDMTSLSIRQAIEKVDNGQLRIPKFQRGFVWDAERVAYLMDSIYKGYPFGSLILWAHEDAAALGARPRPLHTARPGPRLSHRLCIGRAATTTSVFGAFQTDLQPRADADTAWTHIYFDYAAAADLQESQFVALHRRRPGTVLPDQHVVQRHGVPGARCDLTNERVTLIDSVQATFKEANLPVQLFETDDRAKVAIVFERVNRLGVELDTLQLLSAWALE